MELEVKQKLQEGGKKRENLGEHTFNCCVSKFQKQSVPIFVLSNMKIFFSLSNVKCSQYKDMYLEWSLFQQCFNFWEWYKDIIRQA